MQETLGTELERKIMEHRPYCAPRKHGPRIAVIGGGHGLSNMLRGLKEYTENLSEIGRAHV